MVLFVFFNEGIEYLKYVMIPELQGLYSANNIVGLPGLCFSAFLLGGISHSLEAWL